MKVLLILSALILVGCSPSRRIARIAKNHPEVIQKDTVVVLDTFIVESVQIDTTTIFVPQKRVEVINNERVRLVYQYDTLTREIWHELECKGDTIINKVFVPVEKIVVQEKKAQTKWVWWAVVGGFFLGVLVFRFRW